MLVTLRLSLHMGADLMSHLQGDSFIWCRVYVIVASGAVKIVLFSQLHSYPPTGGPHFTWDPWVLTILIVSPALTWAALPLPPFITMLSVTGFKSAVRSALVCIEHLCLLPPTVCLRLLKGLNVGDWVKQERCFTPAQQIKVKTRQQPAESTHVSHQMCSQSRINIPKQAWTSIESSELLIIIYSPIYSSTAHNWYSLSLITLTPLSSI